jgi:glucokinase
MEVVNESDGFRVGIEVRASALKAVAIDRSGRIAASQSTPLSDNQPTLPQIKELIAKLRSDFGEFEKIGIAVPGLINRKTGRVTYSVHIPEHSDIDFANEIIDAAGLKCFVENDANAAAYGELVLGAGRGCDNFFYATLGDGVGGAFIFGGEIWHGASGFAGELGYVPINSEGMRLEEVASSPNIIRRTRSRFHYDSTSSLNKLPEEAITLDDIIAAANADDDFAQMMLERTGVYVGTAVATVINLLNLERIVIGGDIMQAKSLVLNAIKERASELSFEPAYAATEIVEGELGEYAAAAGAALLAATNL